MSGDNKPALVALRRRRDEIVETLSHHFAHDALTIEEFEERLEIAHQATAPSELDALVTDLVVSSPPEPEPKPDALVVRDSDELATPADESKRITSVLSNVRRRGMWRVPKKLRVLSVLGEATIDFREVRLPPGVTRVEAKSILGNIKIIVPPTLAVECEGGAILGEFDQVHRAPHQPDPEQPLLIIEGRVILGELKVETRLSGEGWWAKRKRLKEAAQQKRLPEGS